MSAQQGASNIPSVLWVGNNWSAKYLHQKSQTFVLGKPNQKCSHSLTCSINKNYPFNGPESRTTQVSQYRRKTFNHSSSTFTCSINENTRTQYHVLLVNCKVALTRLRDHDHCKQCQIVKNATQSAKKCGRSVFEMVCWFKKTENSSTSSILRKVNMNTYYKMRTTAKYKGGWWRWALVSPDGVVPSRMVNVSSVNLPLHHKVQKFSSGSGSPGWSWKKGRKTVVVQQNTTIKQNDHHHQYSLNCPKSIMTLIWVLVISKVDYCCSKLTGVSGHLLDRCQLVLNAIAWLVFSLRYSDNINPIYLHWLQVL